MQAVTQLGPLGQISRMVRDIAEAETFYGTMLGLPQGRPLALVAQSGEVRPA